MHLQRPERSDVSANVSSDVCWQLFKGVPDRFVSVPPFWINQYIC